MKTRQTPWHGHAKQISHEKAEMLHKFLVEFGMTPSSRGRVKVESPKAKDQFEKFLEEGLTVIK